MAVGDRADAGIFTFRKVANTNTPIPGGTGNFLGVSEVSIDEGRVAFRGFGSSSQNGIYTDVTDSLTLF